MIYPETGWFQIIRYTDKQAEITANPLEQTRLYLRPTIIMYYCGNGLLSYAFTNDTIKNEYGIKAKCATAENPQAN